MKQFLLLLTFTLSLFAQNPNSFAALGDVIYNDIEKFEKLKQMPSMKEYQESIEEYIKAAERTKKMGFAIDAKEEGAQPKAYLKALRELSLKHDGIIVMSRKRFTEAMNDEDSETVNLMLTYGVIDPENYQTELIAYYEEFGEDHNLSAVTPLYEQHLKSIKKDDNVTRLTDEQREALENEEHLKRVRARMKAKEEALQKSVNEEEEREKKKVLSTHQEAMGK